jgi:hypothetical protein
MPWIVQSPSIGDKGLRIRLSQFSPLLFGLGPEGFALQNPIPYLSNHQSRILNPEVQLFYASIFEKVGGAIPIFDCKYEQDLKQAFYFPGPFAVSPLGGISRVSDLFSTPSVGNTRHGHSRL